MRKLKQSLVLVVAFTTMIACNKNNYENDILGKWEYNAVSIVTYNGDEANIHEEVYEHLCANQKDFIHFKENGILHSAEFNEDCDASESTGTWNIKGDVITVKYNGVESFKGIIGVLEDGRLEVKDDKESNDTIQYYIEFVQVSN